MEWAWAEDKLSSWEGAHVLVRMVWPGHYLGRRIDATGICYRGNGWARRVLLGSGRRSVETTQLRNPSVL